MRYLKKQLRSYGRPFAGDAWGPFTVFLEIDDQHVSRQVNVYEDGQILRYDRSHWCDDFGMMFIGRFSRKQKAAHGYDVTDAKEFNKQWRRALQSDLWAQQIESSRHDSWGAWQDRVGDQH